MKKRTCSCTITRNSHQHSNISKLMSRIVGWSLIQRWPIILSSHRQTNSTSAQAFGAIIFCCQLSIAAMQYNAITITLPPSLCGFSGSACVTNPLHLAMLHLTVRYCEKAGLHAHSSTKPVTALRCMAYHRLDSRHDRHDRTIGMEIVPSALATCMPAYGCITSSHATSFSDPASHHTSFGILGALRMVRRLSG